MRAATEMIVHEVDGHPAYDEPDWLPRMTLRGVDTLRVTLR